MDHGVVVREKITERYLLNELDPRDRDQFEEHFFECSDCALDVRAGATFLEQSKLILAQKMEPSTVPVAAPAKKIWFGWLRPSFAAPVMALMLGVIAYQNLVTYPELRGASQHPRVLQWASVNVGTWGAGGPVITTSNGNGFLLFVRIPPVEGYSRYTADLYDPSGKLEWSLSVPATSGSQDQWPIQVPGRSQWQPGTYTLTVHGITGSGESKDVGRSSFELQVQK
jgi:hypothetical protein